MPEAYTKQASDTQKNIRVVQLVAINSKIIDCALKIRHFFLRHYRRWEAIAVSVLLASGLVGFGIAVAAPGDSNIRATRHNLSNSGITNNAYATTETQVCVFCHTPHNATASAQAPLWNRKLNTQTYTRYTSASLDANNIANGFSDQPGGSSVLCLSCHDGMIALGEVGVLPKNTGTPNGSTSIAMKGPNGVVTTIPVGQGVNTGYTRIGTDLTNDHPISITYNDTLANADGELAHLNSSQRDTGSNPPGTLIGIRSSGFKPLLPLEPTGPGGLGQIQCATCHDPHITKSKFLRLNRLQTNAGPSRSSNSDSSFNQANDIICLACHTKLGAAWANSAHANETVADETYTAAAAALRGFPAGTKVWQASCLNCHDTHTVQGSRRLLREGTGVAAGTADSTELAVASGPATGAVYQSGVAPNVGDNNVSSSIETTCFQCHRPSGGTNAITAATGIVPSVKTLFDLRYGMPMKSSQQADSSVGGKERHNITNADLIESPENLGHLDKTARHAECPDCHNPHRLVRNSKFNGLGDASLRTNQPVSTVSAAALENNVASGVLRGGWGVQPTFSAVATSVWPRPTGIYSRVQGDPGASTSISNSNPYLTHEYQLCFKCHSDYANGPNKTDFALLGYSLATRTIYLDSDRGTTVTSGNGMVNYTNVAAEFNSVNAGIDALGYAITNTDQGEGGAGTACNGAPCITNGSNDGSPSFGVGKVNHRSWHPVLFPTGRDRAVRTMAAYPAVANLRPPFDANIGRQTMQCNNCHGQSSSWQPGVGPIASQPQGPHGSQWPFLLKGKWDTTVAIGGTGFGAGLCMDCHQPGTGGSTGATGFSPEGHNHGADLDAMKMAPCMNCHIAVPHGWKNKAFLVNLNCVGTETGRVGNCDVVGAGSWNNQTMPPYYYSARLTISSWQRSGTWTKSNGCANMDSACK